MYTHAQHMIDIITNTLVPIKVFGLRKCVHCRDKLFHSVSFNYTLSVPLSEVVKKNIPLHSVFLGRYLILYFKAINILWH